MAAPSSTTITNPYPSQSMTNIMAPATDLLVYDAGSDTGLIPVYGAGFMVTVDSTLAVVTAAGTAVTIPCKASVLYPFRIKQIKATGSTFGSGALVLIPYSPAL